MVPRSGEVIRVTRAASVQFVSPMLFRVIRVHDWSTYDGWAWLDGYELNNSGDAVDRRSIFVQVSGLQRAHATLPTRLGAIAPGTANVKAGPVAASNGNRSPVRPIAGQTTRNESVGATTTGRSSMAAAGGTRRR